MEELAAAIRRCLDDAEPDVALARLADDFGAVSRIPMVEGRFGFPRPHDVVGVAIQLVAGAMIWRSRSAEARPFIDTVAASFDWGQRSYARGDAFGALVGALPFLWVPGIVASIAEADWAGAVTAILAFHSLTRFEDDGGPPRDPAALALTAHPNAAAYGPFRYEPGWVLGRQEAVLQAAPLDARLEETWNFFQLFVENAIICGEPARALPLIEAQGLDLVDIGDTTGGHFQFDAICALAALGREDEAMTAAEELVRQGYSLRWRFNLDSATKMAWTQKMRQNECLAALAETPRYKAFLLERVAWDPLPVDDPARAALCAVREDTWAGKAKTRCWLSRKSIVTGDPVIRIRRLHQRAADGGFDIAAKSAFDASGWAEARRRFEADRVPLTCLFPPPRSLHRDEWKTPAISAFHFDVAHHPADFDLDRAVALIADHAPNPIRYEWGRARRDWDPAFEPYAGDRGHGDAVNLTWRLLKAGFGPGIFARVAALDQARADKVFAMLAVFDRADCRAAAAAHFDLPELPAMMTLAFGARPKLDTHLAMAAFADANARWRAGFVAAMRAYALHLYSNYHPEADWFCAGLEQFTRAACCQLLYFLIHHPEDDEVLATMIEKRWLPSGVSTGGFDAYENAQAFYYRAVVLNRMIHAPDELDFWLESSWVAAYADSAKDRETRRLVAQYRKVQAPKSRSGRRAME